MKRDFQPPEFERDAHGRLFCYPWGRRAYGSESVFGGTVRHAWVLTDAAQQVSLTLRARRYRAVRALGFWAAFGGILGYMVALGHEPQVWARHFSMIWTSALVVVAASFVHRAQYHRAVTRSLSNNLCVEVRKAQPAGRRPSPQAQPVGIRLSLQAVKLLARGFVYAFGFLWLAQVVLLLCERNWLALLFMVGVFLCALSLFRRVWAWFEAAAHEQVHAARQAAAARGDTREEP